MAGGVGNDELAARRGEVAIGDVDRDALLAFGAETIGEEREVDGTGGAIHRAFLDRGELIFEGALGVIEQAADEGRFAVIDASASEQAEQFLAFFFGEERGG